MGRDRVRDSSSKRGLSGNVGGLDFLDHGSANHMVNILFRDRGVAVEESSDGNSLEKK